MIPEVVGGTEIPQAKRASDCGAERWLTADGRAQAQRIGEALSAAGFGKARVFTAPSCAAVEAGRLMGLGGVTVQPLLDDVTQTNLTRTRQYDELSLFLADHFGNPTIILISYRTNVIDLSELYLDIGDAIQLRVQLGSERSIYVGPVKVGGK